jgi:hypothetical protein
VWTSVFQHAPRARQTPMKLKSRQLLFLPATITSPTNENTHIHTAEMDPAYAFEKPGNIALSKPAMFETSNAFNIPDGPEGRLCGNDSRCSQPGKSRCVRCKVRSQPYNPLTYTSLITQHRLIGIVVANAKRQHGRLTRDTAFHSRPNPPIPSSIPSKWTRRTGRPS